MSVDIDRIMGCLCVDNMTATEVSEIHRYLQHQEAEIERLREALSNIADLYDTDEGCRSLPEYIAASAALSGETT